VNPYQPPVLEPADPKDQGRILLDDFYTIHSAIGTALFLGALIANVFLTGYVFWLTFNQIR